MFLAFRTCTLVSIEARHYLHVVDKPQEPPPDVTQAAIRPCLNGADDANQPSESPGKLDGPRGPSRQESQPHRHAGIGCVVPGPKI